MQLDIMIRANIDIDYLQDLLDSVDYYDIEIDCDDVDHIYGSDTNEKIDYLMLCDKIGNTYSYYCDHHKKYFTESEYNENYIGIYDSLSEYAMEYIQSTVALFELPSIIRENIDYAGVATDLTSDLTAIKIEYKIAIYRY